MVSSVTCIEREGEERRAILDLLFLREDNEATTYHLLLFLSIGPDWTNPVQL